MSASRTILIAGMPRSGSTWCYNAARLLLAWSGAKVHSTWIADYDPHHAAPIHLVKVHEPRDVAFTPDIILTTWRPYAECLASLVRMGWISSDPDDIRAEFSGRKAIHTYWKARSDLETDYADIVGAPARAISEIARVLGLETDAERDARIARELSAMRNPDGSATYDPETLMHPGHRSTRHAEAPVSATQIAGILRDLL